jgi:hypothetical protein
MRKEALVWNTRLRMQKEVGVAGNGGDVLNGQTTKQDSVASGVGELFTVNTAGNKDRGPCRQADLHHVPKVFRQPDNNPNSVAFLPFVETIFN